VLTFIVVTRHFSVLVVVAVVVMRSLNVMKLHALKHRMKGVSVSFNRQTL